MDEKTKFGRINAGYSIAKRTHPENGDLYLDGERLHHDLPFALLQYEKRKLMQQGYTSKRIEIKYKSF